MRTWTKSDVNVDKKRCKRGQKAMRTWTKSDVNVDKKRCKRGQKAMWYSEYIQKKKKYVNLFLKTRKIFVF
ncbi:TPA: hypothetical protein IX848_001985 [Enterococcus faecium]|nr:hypothetical protein [Enterococcus faecium]HAQ5615830.1 hypothetical protein [Enterococcus faecium]HAQ5667831.1 hypothetical protein [Enterococcus faecium]HAQ5882185.1 hypothetical protein [Enterococcus faecium]HAQ5912574.1 hypothetical protein [Enterococcus faecium]